MQKFTSSILAALCVIMVMSATTFAAPLKLPTSFEGHWEGVPQNTVLGPWSKEKNGLFRFSIIPTQKTALNGSAGWLMQDYFMPANYFIEGSVQQFWVDADKKFLLYCGKLVNFGSTSGPSPVTSVFNLTSQTENQVVWTMDTQGWGFPAATWTQTVSADGSHFTSTLILGSPSVHFNCTYKRVSSPFGVGNTPEMDMHHAMKQYRVFQSTSTASSSSGAADSNKGKGYGAAVDVPVGGSPWPAPCNISWSAKEGLRVNHIRQAMKVGGDTTSKREGMKLVCPHGFTEKDGPMPDFVRKMLSKQQQDDEKANKINKLEGVQPNIAGGEYKHCYVLNPALDVTLEWNWNISSKSIDVQVSASAEAVGGSAHNMYVAVGIQPEFPGMQGMDIVLGYFNAQQPCVRSMYSDVYVGMPVANPSQKLANTNLETSTDGKRLSMKFSRPWATGHHTLPISRAQNYFPQVAWAIGAAPSTSDSCDVGYPGYHGDNRGTIGLRWESPEEFIPNKLKCKK